jgi:hypothetical protein
MFQYINSFFKKHKQRQQHKRLRRSAKYIGSIALRKYKIALIDLFTSAGPQRKKLILLKTKTGNIWSKRQFNKILAKVLKRHPTITYNECIMYLDYVYLKNDFILCNKNFFLTQIQPL